MDWKAGEYTANRDRLLNFKQVAEFLNRRPAEVALAYFYSNISSPLPWRCRAKNMPGPGKPKAAKA